MGVALNKKLRNLIQQLGEAIHETVAESEHVAGVVKDIREEGFDVMLMLEATIGLNEVETQPLSDMAKDEDTADEKKQDGPFTSQDMNFLKSLRISLAEDTEDENAADAA
ncbi:MAG: hypothetical protein ACYC46_02590 [Acidobacteriaceae bacterium]